MIAASMTDGSRYQANRLFIVLLLFAFTVSCILTCSSSALGSEKNSSSKIPSGKVLILNSYHRGFHWSDREQSTIVRMLDRNKLDNQPVIEYMDSRRYPGEDHLKRLQTLYLQKYRDKKFSLVVALDDPAFNFAVKHHAQVFGEAPIVFCGVGNFSPAMLAGDKNVTGFVDKADPASTIEVMLRLHPHAREIFVLHDYTAAGVAIFKDFEAVFPRFTGRVRFRANDNLVLDEIFTELERLPQDTLVLLLSYATDKIGHTYDVADVTRIFSEHSAVPMYGHAEVRLGHGIVGGKLLSPVAMATETATLIQRILRGEDIRNIPVVTKATSQFMFDYRQMERFKISLASLPPNSIVLNQPVSFYTAHRDIILAASGIIVFLAIVILLLFANIFQRRQAALALRESEERYQALFEQAGDGIFVLDSRGKILSVNTTFANMHGFTVEEILHLGLEGLDVEGMAAVPDRICQIIAGKTLSFEVEHYHKDGSTFPLSVTANLVSTGKERLIIAIHHDLTERKRAEEALLTSEKAAIRLARENELIAEIGRIIGSTLNIGEVYGHFSEKVRELIPYDRIAINTVNTKDHTRTIQYVKGDRFSGNRLGEVRSLVGSGTEEVVRSKSSLLINSKNRENMMGKFPGITSLQLGAQSTMMVPLISQGIVIAAFSIHSAKMDAYSENDLSLAERVGSQIAGAIANAQLYLERKRSEEALQESESKFRGVAEQTIVGISIIQNGILQYVNPKYAQMHGYSVEEMIGMPYVEAIYPDDIPLVEGFIRKRLAGEVISNHYECRKIKSNGEPFHVEVYGVPSLYNNRPAVLGIIMDITDRKRAEEEKQSLQQSLQRAEKMEALGQLAGGVAHDLNNVLGVLSGYSELLMERIPAGNPLREYAANILKSSAKGAAIIDDLLTLARRGVVLAEVVDFNRIIGNLLAAPELERLKDYHSSVNFKTDLEKELLNIKGSPVHLEKTLLNLVANAAEAISGRGEVQIRTETRYLDHAVHGYDTVEAGDYVVLTVSDTGTGISSEDMSKMFEPFYTKKKMGRSGTGLGLAIVWGTVKDHHGYIDVQSTEGRGTTFTLYFPVTREKMVEDVRKTPVEQYLGKGEAVLVVDDVEEQRQVATTLLMRLDYLVKAVSSGEEAVEYLKTNQADILVLDMIMTPGIDGLETYRRVLEINPKQKAILVSGFSETDRVKEAQQLGAGAYVKKPYVMEKIGVAVRTELDRE